MSAMMLIRSVLYGVCLFFCQCVAKTESMPSHGIAYRLLSAHAPISMEEPAQSVLPSVPTQSSAQAPASLESAPVLILEQLKKSAPEKEIKPDALQRLVDQLEQAPSSLHAELKQQILAFITHDLSFADLYVLVEQLEKDKLPSLRFAHATVLLRAALLQKHIGQLASAQKLFQTLSGLSESFGKTEAITLLVDDQLKELANIEQVEQRKIGVLLPLSGSRQEFGLLAKQAIEMVFNTSLKDNTRSNAVLPPIELVFKDTQGNEEQARIQTRDLILNTHVMAIMGPLFADESYQAAMVAQAYQVPLLNLSRAEGITRLGSSVFRLCLTPEQQSQALVDLMVDAFHFKRFAVLYPSTDTGLEFVQSFFSAVEKKGAEVVGIESYLYDQNTFTTPVKKLVGRYYLELRQQDLSKEMALAMRQIRKSSVRGAKAYEKAKDRLSAVVDFDALFIPDTAKAVSFIAPAIAFEDVDLVVSEKDRQQIKNSDDPLILSQYKRMVGVHSWNSPLLVERAGKAVEGAIFVDGFDVHKDDAHVQEFVKKFESLTQKKPTLPEAQAYDAAGIFKLILSQNPHTRMAFLKLLSGLKDYLGVTGKIHFDTQGEAQKKLVFLTVENGEIVPFQAHANEN